MTPAATELLSPRQHVRPIEIRNQSQSIAPKIVNLVARSYVDPSNDLYHALLKEHADVIARIINRKFLDTMAETAEREMLLELINSSSSVLPGNVVQSILLEYTHTRSAHNDTKGEMPEKERFPPTSQSGGYMLYVNWARKNAEERLEVTSTAVGGTRDMIGGSSILANGVAALLAQRLKEISNNSQDTAVPLSAGIIVIVGAEEFQYTVAYGSGDTLHLQVSSPLQDAFRDAGNIFNEFDDRYEERIFVINGLPFTHSDLMHPISFFLQIANIGKGEVLMVKSGVRDHKPLSGVSL